MIGGVKKLAQINYEKGKRHPDSEYLAALARAGIDVLYILTGKRCPIVIDEPNVANSRHLAERNVATSRHLAERADSVTQGEAGLPPDEQLVLEAYRSLNPAARKELLAELLTGRKKPKAKPREGIKVSGNANRVAGRDFNEQKE